MHSARTSCRDFTTTSGTVDDPQIEGITALVQDKALPIQRTNCS